MSITEDTIIEPATLDIEDRPSSRRRFFALAGGAAAAAVAVNAITSASPAEAANGLAINLSVPNQITPGPAVGTVLDYTPATVASGVSYLTVTDSGDGSASEYPSAIQGSSEKIVPTGVYGHSSKSAGNGVVGQAKAGAGPTGYGVWGKATSGYGVVATAETGISLAVYGTGRVIFSSNLPAGPPTVGTYGQGEILRDNAATFFVCIEGGTPGKWRVLGGGTTAGSLYVINPTRVFDSRLSGFGGSITSSGERTVSVANGIDLGTGVVNAPNVVPAGATAICYNLTIANAVAQGFLAVTPGDATTFAASTINWTATTPTIANGTLVKLDGNRQVKVFAGGGGTTDFIIDVTGYYI